MLRSILELDVARYEEYFRELEVRYGEPIKPPFIIRLDGVGFGRRLSGFKVPRDLKVHKALVKAAKELIKYFNADYGLVISDEVNIFVMNTVPYGGRYEKIISISSGIVSTYTSLSLKKNLYFDSRIIRLRNINDILTYFTYRIRVGFNNYVSSLYHKVFTDKETPHLKVMIDKLRSKGIDVGKVSEWELYGTCILWETYMKKGYNPITHEEVMTVRRRLKALGKLSKCLKHLTKLCFPNQDYKPRA